MERNYKNEYYNLQKYMDIIIKKNSDTNKQIIYLIKNNFILKKDNIDLKKQNNDLINKYSTKSELCFKLKSLLEFNNIKYNK